MRRRILPAGDREPAPGSVYHRRNCEDRLREGRSSAVRVGWLTCRSTPGRPHRDTAAGWTRSSGSTRDGNTNLALRAPSTASRGLPGRDAGAGVEQSADPERRAEARSSRARRPLLSAGSAPLRESPSRSYFRKSTRGSKPGRMRAFQEAGNRIACFGADRYIIGSWWTRLGPWPRGRRAGARGTQYSQLFLLGATSVNGLQTV